MHPSCCSAFVMASTWMARDSLDEGDHFFAQRPDPVGERHELGNKPGIGRLNGDVPDFLQRPCGAPGPTQSFQIARREAAEGLRP